MAYTKTPKLFAYDLSNYAEIRRGLSPAMRKLTPSKTMLKQADEHTRRTYIEAINKWRTQSQTQKLSTAHTQEGISNVLISQGKNNYYSKTEQVIIVTAGLKLKTMDPRAAEWELREALNASGRLHDNNFYKAQYYLDGGEWDPTQATNEMLQAVISGGTLPRYGANIVDQTIKEYMQRIYNITESKDKEFIESATAQEKQEMVAGYYNDILNIAKMVVGV